MTRYISLNFLYAQKSFKYVAEALTPLLRLGTFSWIVTRDSHQNLFLNSQPWSRPTRQRSAAHQWAAAHRLRTAGLGGLADPGLHKRGGQILAGIFERPFFTRLPTKFLHFPKNISSISQKFLMSFFFFSLRPFWGFSVTTRAKKLCTTLGIWGG